MLLKKLKPEYWFSAHLHVKYAAIYNHLPIIPPKPVENPDEINLDSSDDEEENTVDNSINKVSSTDLEPPKITKFLALDKCLPKRQFLQVIQVPASDSRDITLDPEWLSIVKATSRYMPFTREGNHPPLPSETDLKTAIQQARQWVDSKGPDLLVPPTFCKTAEGIATESFDSSSLASSRGLTYCNPQTARFCENLEITNQINPNGVKVDYPTFSSTIASHDCAEKEALAMAKRRLLERLGDDVA